MGYDIKKKGHNAVFGVFDDRASLDRDVDSIREHGFRNSDVSILMQSESDIKNIPEADQADTKAPEGLAQRYEELVQKGGRLLSVHVHDRRRE